MLLSHTPPWREAGPPKEDGGREAGPPKADAGEGVRWMRDAGYCAVVWWKKTRGGGDDQAWVGVGPGSGEMGEPGDSGIGEWPCDDDDVLLKGYAAWDGEKALLFRRMDAGGASGAGNSPHPPMGNSADPPVGNSPLPPRSVPGGHAAGEGGLQGYLAHKRTLQQKNVAGRGTRKGLSPTS